MSLDVMLTKDGEEVYSSNITHNLAKMADAAGIYYACWRPEERGYKYAGQISPILAAGIEHLKNNQTEMEKLNASNGWGKYENFVPWVESYYQACRDYPDAEISTSR